MIGLNRSDVHLTDHLENWKEYLMFTVKPMHCWSSWYHSFLYWSITEPLLIEVSRWPDGLTFRSKFPIKTLLFLNYTICYIHLVTRTAITLRINATVWQLDTVLMWYCTWCSTTVLPMYYTPLLTMYWQLDTLTDVTTSHSWCNVLHLTPTNVLHSTPTDVLHPNPTNVLHLTPTDLLNPTPRQCTTSHSYRCTTSHS